MVHQLEEHLGVKLLDRWKRPFVLTPEGEIFHEGCRKLVQRYFALEEEVRTLHAEVSGRVSVASIYSVGLSHMNQIVQKFLRKYPKANVRMQYQHPDRVYELVETDQVDMGLVSYPRSSRNIRAVSWREEPMRMVCAPSHPLADRETVRLEELQGLAMVSFDGNLEIRNEIDRELTANGVSVKVVMEFDNTETIKRAVEIDAGFSLLPAPTVEREVQAGSLRAIPISGSLILRPVGIIVRKGKELGQTARRFLQLLQEHSNLPPAMAGRSTDDVGHDDSCSDDAPCSRVASSLELRGVEPPSDDLAPGEIEHGEIEHVEIEHDDLAHRAISAHEILSDDAHSDNARESRAGDSGGAVPLANSANSPHAVAP